MRVLSPRMLPRVTGLLGSTASTATRWPALEQVEPERFDERALAHAGRAGDADAQRAARVRHQRVEDLLAALGVIGARALEQRDRARDRAAVARADRCANVRSGLLRFAHRLRARTTWSTSRAAFGTAVPGPNTAATPLSRRNA